MSDQNPPDYDTPAILRLRFWLTVALSNWEKEHTTPSAISPNEALNVVATITEFAHLMAYRYGLNPDIIIEISAIVGKNTKRIRSAQKTTTKKSQSTNQR